MRHSHAVPHEPPAGVTHLAAHECWALLRASQVGRLAVVTAGRPDIFPVNYVVDHGTVVFRTAEGTKLAAILDNADVAFEVDGYEPAAGNAWSVVLKGRARQLHGADELTGTTGLPLFPWHASPKPRFIRLETDELTGRRFVAAGSDTWLTPLSGVRPAGSD